MGKEEDKEDQRKEASIRSSAALRPNFQAKGITQQQLSKFQELHRKRLQIKSKSKCEKKPKARTGKSQHKTHHPVELTNQESSISTQDSLVPNSDDSHTNRSGSLVQQEDAPKKRQKLHWGLDTKERWERKANM